VFAKVKNQNYTTCKDCSRATENEKFEETISERDRRKYWTNPPYPCDARRSYARIPQKSTNRETTTTSTNE
jgi:hypothetical protein